jgi:hypothetical protein
MNPANPDLSLEQSPDSALITQHKLLPVNCVTCSVAYVNDESKSKEGLLSLLCGEKVVMRTKIVASATAASVLLMAASASQPEAQRSQEVKMVPVVVADIAMSAKRPLLTDIAMSAKRPLLTDIAMSAKRPLIAVA